MIDDGTPKIQDLMDLLQQCAHLLALGLPLPEALNTLKTHSGDQNLMEWIDRCCEKLQQGQSLSEQLQPFQKGLGAAILGLIEAGEQSAKLGPMLLAADAQYRQQQRLKKNLSKASLYPVFLLVLVLAMTVTLLLTLVPQITAMYQQAHHQLPAITALLIDTSQWVERDGLMLLLGLITSLGLITETYDNSPKYAAWMDKIRLNLPILGSYHLRHQLAGWSDTLSQLLLAHVPLMKALDLANSTLKNQHLRHRLASTRHRIHEGQTLSQALAGSEPLIQQLKRLMFRAEQSHSLPELLLHFSEQQQHILTDQVERMTTLLEPCLMLIISLIVGFFVIALYSPLFQIGTLL